MQRFFRTVSKQMEEQIRGVAEALQHPGMKGIGAEEALRAFLRRYMPNRYRIGQGKVVDYTGSESRQIDIIIMDAMTTTPLYVDDTNLVVPIESVYATVEVKTTLNRKSMADAVENVLTVQNLFLPSKYQLVRGGAVVEKSRRDIYPKGFVFALNRQKSSAIDALGMQYLEFVRKRKIKFPLVSCCAILGAGYFVDVPLDDPSGQGLYGAQVHIQKTAADDTLLLFLLCVIESLGLMKDRARPWWELYLNLYGRGAKITPLSND